MAQTLRKNFSHTTHQVLKPVLRRGFSAPLSFEGLLLELRQYLQQASQDLLQPRQECIDRILREALY